MNEPSAILRFALLLVRPGMLLAFAPALGGRSVPTEAKVALSVFLALALVPTVPVPATASLGTLVLTIGREAAIGLALGAALQALIGGIEFAGHMSGFQMGFSYAATIDPMTGARDNTVSSLFSAIAVLTFLNVDGHHMMLRALAASYDGLPVGLGAVADAVTDRVQDMFALMFSVGARLAAPIVIVMLVLEVGVALISKMAPSLSFQVLGYPLRLVVGLFVLGGLISAVPRVFEPLVETATRLGLATARVFQ